MARKRLNETLGSVSFDNIVGSGTGKESVVKLATGQGVLQRGTILAAREDGMVKIGADTTGKASAVLAETVDTDGKASVVGIAYKAGHFNANKLIVADGYELTTEDKESLRTMGILVSGAAKPSIGFFENAALGRAKLGSMILGG